MNFYDYYQPGESLKDSPVLLAAQSLIENNLQVIPLKKGAKEPANIKSVYELISRPINKANVEFYFNRNVDIGLILDPAMEFLDIEEKNKPGLSSAVLEAIEYGWPEVYDKLVIAQTATGGIHILYRSEITGGETVLARIAAFGSNPLPLVERISRSSHKQYMKIAPSDGYRFIQNSPIEIQMLTAEERNWLCSVAASFNEVIIPEVKQKEADRKDSPWTEFNRLNNWRWIRSELMDRGWIVVADFPDRVIIKRPGNSPQRASGKIFKEKNVLYLFTSSTEFENGKSYTPFGVYTLLYHGGDIKLACRELVSRNIGKSNYDEGEFWRAVSKSKIEIRYRSLRDWLFNIGFRKYKGSIVQVINNVVEISCVDTMKRAFLNEVEYEVYDRMNEKVSTIFSADGGLMAMIDELDDNFIIDTRDSCWLFFKNLAIKITTEKVIPHEYSELSGYIWKSQIIDREFFETGYSGSDIDRFFDILAGDRKQILMQIVGYSISTYKNRANSRAIVITEDIDPEDEGESQGGSGKGLLFQFISQYRKSSFVDGKTFKLSNPFVWHNIDHDTNIIFIDDVLKNFNFSLLFSVISEGMTVNKKNQPQFVIPFDRSPKLFITSNFTVGGMDISSRRRKYEFAVNKYFGIDITPFDEFGRMFFCDQWDYNEWMKCDNLAACCVIEYLKSGVIQSDSSQNIEERVLLSNTNKDFVDYMDQQLACNFFDFAPPVLRTARVINPDGSVTVNAVDMEKFERNRNNPDYYFTIRRDVFYEKIREICHLKTFTTHRMTQWFKSWAAIRMVEIDTRYQRLSTSAKDYRIINWKHEKAGGSDKGKSWRPSTLW